MLTSPPVFTLLCLLSMVQAEVVDDFTPCSWFFYKNQEPALGDAGPHISHICQRYRNRYHFATLYDTQNRIPVYSAYIFKLGNGLNKGKTWFVEPQLGISSSDMSLSSDCPLMYKPLQAVDEDYNNSGFDRGHLNPCSHNSPGDSTMATFTLTNAVPQNHNMNSGAWRNYEGNLRTLFEIKLKCSMAYVVTGAIPSANTWINNRVNVPDYLWNAYCCVDKTGKPIGSGAALVENKSGVTVQVMSLDDLVQRVGVIFEKNCNGKVDEKL